MVNPEMQNILDHFKDHNYGVLENLLISMS